jgi:hypothetical protein
MSNLQKALDALQPYVIGIRYLDGMPVVDAVFKEDWTLPQSNTINKVKGNNDVNYYMLFSETDGIGLDELLTYVDVTIKTNIEKEKKHELLKQKVNELKELFKQTSLLKLQNLKFIFAEEDLMPSIQELEIKELPEETASTNLNINEEENTEVLRVDEIEKQRTPESSISEESLTDEEREILEEERRAENYRKFQEMQKSNQQLENIKKKVELPPKKNFETKNKIIEEQCECGPDEACDKCIDKKSL